MNKSNLNSARISLNSTSEANNHNIYNKNGLNFNILNHDIDNVDENSFDLDMDSAEVPNK